MSRYTGNNGSSELSGQDAYGVFTYLAYLGFSPLGVDSNLRLFGAGADGLSSWWWQRLWPDRRYNPWIKSGTERLAHLVIGAGIEMATPNEELQKLWQRIPRLSSPQAQMAYEIVRQVEGETWLGGWPMPGEKKWGIKRYARSAIQDVICDGGVAVGYRLYDAERGGTILVPDIAYATEHGIPEFMICISDSEDPSVRAEPTIAAAIEPARRLYAYYLGWSKVQNEIAKLGYTWEYDPQVAGVSEPQFDDDGFQIGQGIPQREGGMPTGANIMQTANRREALSKSRELLGAIATAMHLSEFDFGQTQSANRSNADTLERGKREHLRFNQGLLSNAYNAIMRHIAPEVDDWTIQMTPLEDIDTPQRVKVLTEMEEAGLITLASAARLALPLVGLDPDMVEAEIEELLAAQEVDFGDDDGFDFGNDGNEPPPVAQPDDDEDPLA